MDLARCPPRCLKGEMQALVGLSCENLKGSLPNRIANGALRLASKTSRVVTPILHYHTQELDQKKSRGH